jgi:hypothetical protein
MLSRSALIAVCLLTVSVNLLAADAASPDLEAKTDNGATVRIFSQLSPLEINVMHSWLIEISDQNSIPVSNAEITVIGGMPDHDHGLPTLPLITEQVENGVYLLEGVRFHMPGRWQIIVSIQIDNRDDRAVIDFQL